MAGQPFLAPYYYQHLKTFCIFYVVVFGFVCRVWADFIDRFGYPPPDLAYIAVAADSVDTGMNFWYRSET